MIPGLVGHAVTRAYLCNRTSKIPSDKCWRCGRDEGQTRYHLFIRCEAWAPQSKALCRSVGKAHEWKHSRAPQIKTLFEKKATSAVLTFVRDTKVGEIASLAALGGGGDPMGEDGGPGSP